MNGQDLIHAALELRRLHMAPVAEAQRMELSSEATLRSPPLVLLLGNHSSGKSSMINHLLGREVQRTGVAPIDDSFTVLLHGSQERGIDGAALASNPTLPFQPLARFGQGLVQHLAGRVLDCELLRHVVLIDSPGMIDGADANAERPYDFPGVVRWFAEQADLVLLAFDPEKPGTTGETMSVLTDALVGIDHKLRIVMNKMDLFDGIRDFARTYGALCWNLSRSLRTKDLPHIYTTVIPGKVRDNPQLPLDGFAAALLELEQYLSELPGRRADSIITRTADEGRVLLLRAEVAEILRARVASARLQALLPCILGAAVCAAIAWTAWQATDFLWMPVLQAIAGGAAFILAAWYLPALVGHWRERHGHSQLDQFFRERYRDELARRERASDLSEAWQVARAGLTRMLSQIGLAGLRRVSLRRRRKLAQMLEQDLPRLRRLQ